MTSAPNHLLQLNGNKYWLYIYIVLFSCSVPQKTVQTKESQIVIGNKEKVVPTDKEAAKSTTSIQKDTLKESVTKVKIDTVSWKDVSDMNPPVKVTTQVVTNTNDIKPIYNIKLLIPLNSDSYSDPTTSRFTHFYAGLLKALDELELEGIKLNIDVIDTEDGNYKVSENVYNILTADTDLVIGPFEKDDLKLMVEECKIRSITLVSPWQTSTKLTNDNPYYVQIKPNLKDHFVKLADATVKSYQAGEVVIIGKNTKETNSWINYFQQAAAAVTNNKQFYESYFVTADSLNTGPTAFKRLFKNTKIKAIIIPNYSYSDEDFMYGCLRRLAAEKGNRPISVYGMPIMYDSDKVDFDFYHALQMKVVMSDFVDENYGIIREFRRDFLDKYGEIPNADAVKGYDLTMFLGRNLWKYGRKFQNYLENEITTYLQSTYNIQKAKSEDTSTQSDPLRFDYFENKHLDIIEFKGNKWQRKY